MIQNVQEPEGPIEFKRYNPNQREVIPNRSESISTQMIWRMENSILPDKPINVDRVFGGSYNTSTTPGLCLKHCWRIPHFSTAAG